MNTSPDFDLEIKISRIACPLHVLQMKQGMNKLEKGQTLKIKTSHYAFPELLAAARQLGSRVSSNDAKNELFVIKA